MGGWLVLERWITPSLFERTAAQDEFSFMQQPDSAEKIKRHRRTFITESDFHWLADNGVNAVRIPVGYWLFEADGPMEPCILHLDWAVEMAEKYGLKVLIDLHAVKGSQNGNDHSGQIGGADWFKNEDYRYETLEILKRIASRYKHSPAVWGIELLNEPKMGLIRFFILKRFYTRAQQELIRVGRPGMHIVFSDGFVPKLFSGALKQSGDLPVAMDIHWYQFEKTQLRKYFKKITKRSNELRRLHSQQPVIIGEWSGMLSHKTLAGRSNQEQVLLQKQHIEQQLIAYNSALGWFYWTYKTEGNGIWNFRHQVESGNLLLSE